MISRIATSGARRAVVVLALLLALLAGYISSIAGGAPDDARLGGASSACGSTVLKALSQVTQHVYEEGVSSERTEVAIRLIKGSRALREAVEHGNSGAARAAAQALLASGHLTN